MLSKTLWAIGLMVALGGQTEAADRSAAAVFESFKAWVGRWEAPTPEGKTAWKSYRLTGNSTALVEEYGVEGSPESNMVTLYHLDGDDLMLTHYCAAGNQPRMKARWSESTPVVVTFEFVDATNLSSPNEGHMHRAVFELIDEDHVKESWTFRKDGRDQFTEVLQYQRKK